MKCPYCEDVAATHGPYAGYCSTACKKNHAAHLVRIGAPESVPYRQAMEEAKQFKDAAEAEASTKVKGVYCNGVTTCGHIVNGHQACHSKIDSFALSPYCPAHKHLNAPAIAVSDLIGEPVLKREDAPRHKTCCRCKRPSGIFAVCQRCRDMVNRNRRGKQLSYRGLGT